MAFRKEHDLSQGYLAKGIISQPTLSLIEHGKYPLELDVLIPLARKLRDPAVTRYVQCLQDSTSTLEIENEEVLTALEQYASNWTDFHADTALHLAEVFLEQNELLGANKAVDLVIIHHPNSTDFYQACHIKAQILFKSYDYKQAATYLLKIISSARPLSTELKAKTYYNLGYACFFLDKYDLTATYCDEVIALCQMDSKMFWLDAKALALKGAAYHKVGRLEESLACVRDAEVILKKFEGPDIDQFRVKLTLADVLDSLRRYAEAHQCLVELEAETTSLYDIEPTSLSAYYRVNATVLHDLGCLDEAECSAKMSIDVAELAKDYWSLTWSLIIAIGVFKDEEAKRGAAKRALEIALRNDLPGQGAIAAHYLLNLSEVELPCLANQALTMYRAAFFRAAYLENLTALLPPIKEY